MVRFFGVQQSYESIIQMLRAGPRFASYRKQRFRRGSLPNVVGHDSFLSAALKWNRAVV